MNPNPKDALWGAGSALCPLPHKLAPIKGAAGRPHPCEDGLARLLRQPWRGTGTCRMSLQLGKAVGGSPHRGPQPSDVS